MTGKAGKGGMPSKVWLGIAEATHAASVFTPARFGDAEYIRADLFSGLLAAARLAVNGNTHRDAIDCGGVESGCDDCIGINTLTAAIKDAGIDHGPPLDRNFMRLSNAFTDLAIKAVACEESLVREKAQTRRLKVLLAGAHNSERCPACALSNCFTANVIQTALTSGEFVKP